MALPKRQQESRFLATFNHSVSNPYAYVLLFSCACISLFTVMDVKKEEADIPPLLCLNGCFELMIFTEQSFEV